MILVVFAQAISLAMAIQIMCRWLAYLGEPTAIANVLCQPNHSLIDQSLHARLNVDNSGVSYTTNGDGFGIGWYTDDVPQPGRFRDVRPAWNDENVVDLASHIRSVLFFAHIRATDQRDIQRSNCHPFRHGNWLFQHNGQIRNYRTLRRSLDSAISPDLYPQRLGSTDSECCFLLALSFGLADSPAPGLARMVGYIEAQRKSHGIDDPFTFTAVCTNGQALYVVRYASKGVSKTLFHCQHPDALTDLHNGYTRLANDAVVLVSEPLDDLPEHWVEVPDSTFLSVTRQGIEQHQFIPELPHENMSSW